MIRIIAFLFSLVSTAQALKLEFVSAYSLPDKMEFKKTKVGGLSGLWFDKESDSLFAISDDRGVVNEPRFYKFHLELKKYELKLLPESVTFLHMKDSKGKILLDMEGMAPLAWGNFLISSEGDNNKKPRVPPELIDVKKDGTWIRNYDVPGKFIPDSSGEQKKGIRNNAGFEGLTAWADKNLFWAWTEAPLLQDSAGDFGPLRIIQYEMPEAWVIKPTKEFVYLPEEKLTSKESMILASRVSEALAISEKEFLVLERAVSLGVKNLGFNCRLYLASLDGAEDVSGIESLQTKDIGKLKKISKKLLLDLDEIKEKLGGTVDNFEGISFGPLVDGKKTIILVSDNNFKRIQKTQFVLFKLIE